MAEVKPKIKEKLEDCVTDHPLTFGYLELNNEDVSRSEAVEYCAERTAILIPLKTDEHYDEFRAVVKACKPGTGYWVGLEYDKDVGTWSDDTYHDPEWSPEVVHLDEMFETVTIDGPCREVAYVKNIGAREALFAGECKAMKAIAACITEYVDPTPYRHLTVLIVGACVLAFVVLVTFCLSRREVKDDAPVEK